MKAVRLATCISSKYKFIKIGLGKYKCMQSFTCKWLELLSKAVNREFNFVFPESLSTPGHIVKNQDCSRIPDMLRYNKSDFAWEMGFSYEASQKVDLSPSSSIKVIKFIIKEGEEINRDLVIFYPFQWSVWLCTMISLLLCGFVLSALMYRNSTGKQNVKIVCKSILCSLESFCGVRDFKMIRGNAKTETFCALGLLSMRILVYGFCAVLLSFLMAPIIAPTIKTFEELGRAAKLDKIKIRLPRNYTYITQQFQEASESNEAIKNIFDNNYRHIHETIPGSPIYEWLRNGFAVIAEEKYAEMFSSIYDDIFTSDDSFNVQVIGLFYRKGFEDIEAFNKAVLRSSEGRLLNLEFEVLAHMYRRNSFVRPGEFTKEKRPITLSDLKGAFILFAMGIFVALIVFICEKFFYKGNCNKRRTIKRRLCSA